MVLYIAIGKCRVCHKETKTYEMVSPEEADSLLYRLHRRKEGHWFEGEIKIIEVPEVGQKP